MNESTEKIIHKGKILAIILRQRSLAGLWNRGEKVHFITPNDFPFQVAVHNRARGEVIAPHFHVPFPLLQDFPVQEFFYVLSGRVKIDLYDDREQDRKVQEVELREGDSITLNTGHGFTFLEDARLIELKQGPYRGKEKEKRFV